MATEGRMVSDLHCVPSLHHVRWPLTLKVKPKRDAIRCISSLLYADEKIDYKLGWIVRIGLVPSARRWHDTFMRHHVGSCNANTVHGYCVIVSPFVSLNSPDDGKH